MDWKSSIERSSANGFLTQFQGVCNERGRQIEYELHGYVDGINWKWKASLVDIATGINASAAGYLGKNGAMKNAMKNLFDNLEKSRFSASSSSGTNTETTPPAALDSSEPRLSQLMNEVAAKIPHLWRLVGDQLEIPPGVLEALSMQHNGRPIECFREVLVHWRRNPEVAYSWESMVKVLRSAAIGQQELAGTITRDHC